MSRPFRAVVVALCILLLNACGNDSGYQNYTVPTGYFRVVNAIPDSPQLNMYVNDVLRQQINYGLSSPFIKVLPRISLRFGANYYANRQPVQVVQDEPVYVDLNHDYTVIMAGTLDNPQLLRIDNPSIASTQEDGKIEFQFANVATKLSNPVDIQLLQNGQVIHQETLQFSEISALFRIAVGDYELKVTDTTTGDLLWQSSSVTLDTSSTPGRGLGVLEDHFGPGSGVRMVNVGEQVSTRFPNEDLPAKMRVANMTPDQGPLDVYVDGNLFAQNVAFQQQTAYFDVAPGTFDVQVIPTGLTPTGDPNAVLSDNASQTISTGEYETLAITGAADVNSVQIYPIDTRPIPIKTTLTAINAAPSAGPVDVYLLADGETVNGVSPVMKSLTEIPSTTSLLELRKDEGTFDLVITTNGTKDILYGPQRVDLANGGLYTLYITDTAGGGKPVEVVYTDGFNP